MDDKKAIRRMFHRRPEGNKRAMALQISGQKGYDELTSIKSDL